VLNFSREFTHMMQALLSLPPSDLGALAAGIRSGRLSAPFPESSIARFLGSSACAEVSEALGELTASGMELNAIAVTLDLLSAALESRPRLDDVIDLVTTSPDATRIANRDTGAVVSQLFREARSSVLVSGYAVHQGRRVFQALAERMKEAPELEVRMFLDIQRGNGDTSAPEELVRRFLSRFRTTEWPMGAPIPQIYYDLRSLSLDRNVRAALHAKCVVVDEAELFVSSANFTEAAQQKNIEVGLLLHSTQIAGRLTEFFNNLAQSGFFLKAH
jgi:hypothetical protein